MNSLETLNKTVNLTSSAGQHLPSHHLTSPKEISQKNLNVQGELKKISDQSLLTKIVSLVREERELLTKILHHLREIESRRLFSSLGYTSLFDFAMKYLGYSGDQAYRRISAMRLLKEIPELEVHINTGELSLSHISLAQSFFKQEKKACQKTFTKLEKITLFERIKNKPIREAVKVTLSLSSAPVKMKPDKVKLITADRIEMKFEASAELQDKLHQLKGLLAHKNPDITLGELFEKLCDLGLQEWSPSKPLKRERKKLESEHVNLSEHKNEHVKIKSPATSKVSFNQTFKETSKVTSKPTSKAQVRREVFKKAHDQCEICASTFALEVDHIIPQAKGGSSHPSNLRVLCRSCNQRAAIDVFGQQKMSAYLT